MALRQMDYADALSSSDHRLPDNAKPSSVALPPLPQPADIDIMPFTDDDAPPPAAVVIEYIASEDLQPLPDPALAMLVSFIHFPLYL